MRRARGSHKLACIPVELIYMLRKTDLIKEQKMPAVRSILQIEQELKAMQTQLGKLQAQRGKIAASLGKIDKEIAALAGGTAAAKRPGPKKAPAPAKKAPPAAKKPSAAPAAKAGPGGGASLIEFIRKVLAPAAEGMRVKEVMAAVTQAGYDSKAKDFYGIVAATLRAPDFEKLSRGVYRVKAASASAKKAPKPAKAGKKAAKKAAPQAAMPAGGLKGLLVQLLAGKKATGVGEAMEAVLASGYQTKAKNFRFIVNQTLYKSEEFKKVARGQYALRG